MIIANITSYEGQCSDAEHYYCSHCNVDDLGDKKPSQTYNGSSFDDNELKRILTDQKEVDYLVEKDRFSGIRIGKKTNRFNSIEQIHNELLKEYPDQDIITYYKDELFRDMLYIRNGVNLGIKEFGEVFKNIHSCYKDLLPATETIKIKCRNCGKEYNIDEATYEWDLMDRTLIQPIKKKDMDEICCNRFELIWNVIL